MDYPPDWTCERTVRQLEYYLLETLVWSESLAVAEHLEACEGCAGRLVLVRMTLQRQPRG